MAKSKLVARETAQGRIAIALGGARGVMVELNCETDFVARNEKFCTLADAVAAAASSLPSAAMPVQPLAVSDLLAARTQSGNTVEHTINTALSALGENITLKRAVAATGSTVGGYLHNNGSYGALVVLAPKAGSGALPAAAQKLGDQIAQHIVAMDPAGELKERTTAAAVKALLGQQYLFNTARTVAAVVEEEGKAFGQGVEVVDYVRWGCGKQ